ncbi:hypothetical protein [Natronosalvus rutilus]|uniref:Uncharacterized protein n=1 Tax=Natronosalvus rutilus TaxID=2953753 RepID=A0A9E7NF02_9EURY|nr:hypothetical protein [Natronosalvus rutilus]UTF55552.1 hypothetical protein NGM29_05955 [Natronosalvus rutilus]
MDDEPEHYDEHLDDLEDGAGCTEIWEHIASNRGQGDTDEADEELEERGRTPVSQKGQ